MTPKIKISNFYILNMNLGLLHSILDIRDDIFNINYSFNYDNNYQDKIKHIHHKKFLNFLLHLYKLK